MDPDPGLVPSAAPPSRPAAFLPLQWTVVVGDETTDVALCGELDLAVADLARGALLHAWHAHRRPIAVDLTGVSFIDSMGLRGLLQALAQISEANGSASIVATSTAVRRVIELSGLASILTAREPVLGGGSGADHPLVLPSRERGEAVRLRRAQPGQEATAADWIRRPGPELSPGR